MKLIVVDTYDELSELSAGMIKAEMLKDKRCNISITVGETPIGAYKILSDWYKKYKVDLKNTFFYNFDESEPLSGSEPITIRDLKELFFTPAEVEPSQIILLNSSNYKEYDKIIENNGGLDFMLFGLGADGHFCGNMPIATNFNQETYLLEVKKEYPWYDYFRVLFPEGDMPDHIITMGLRSLMKVKHLVLIVNGEKKAKALNNLMNHPISETFPASGLRAHPNLTVIADKAAAILLK